MPVQDLTPQLRTRLSRVERAVGWFVTLATLVLLAGFAYYVYHTAQRKGWFITKVKYRTSLNNASGLRPGDPVRLMGFSVGEITSITPNDPADYYGVTIDFRILDPYYGYIWIDSKVRVAPSDFLGNRYLEVMKGRDGAPTVLMDKQLALDGTVLKEKFQAIKQEIAASPEFSDYNEHALRSEATNELDQALRQQPTLYYTNIAAAHPIWIEPLESPALTERLETLATSVELAMPNVLKLTNDLAAVLTNASAAAARLDSTAAQTAPILTNLEVITANLRQPDGSLGAWLLSSNVQSQLQTTIASAQKTLQTAQSTLDNTDTNLTRISAELERSLVNLANLTSNLNWQVQINPNMLGQISTAIAHTDELVQGLKRHWLLRSAFRNKPAPAPAPAPVNPDLTSPKRSP